MSKIERRGPTRGAKASKVCGGDFDDFECRIARASPDLIPQILKDYGDRVTVIYKITAGRDHPWAYARSGRRQLSGVANGSYWISRITFMQFSMK